MLLSLALNFYLMPLMRTAYRVTLTEAIQQNPLKLIVPKTFVRDDKGRIVVYVGGRQGSEISDVWVWRLDKQKRVTEMVRAKSGTLTFRETDAALVVELHDASGERRDPKDPEDFSKPEPVADFGVVIEELPLAEVFQPKKLTEKVNWMTYDQLVARRAELEAKGEKADARERLDLTRVKIALSEKAAASFGVLALAFVAVPLGIKVSRKETSANLGIAVALLLGYYFLAGLIGLLERNPALRPELWVWAPPLAYAATGLWLFRRVDRA